MVRSQSDRSSKKFRIAIECAQQDNVGPLVDLLCADHPLTSEQKKQLADLFVLQADLIQRHKSRPVGRPPAKPFSLTWLRRDAVEQARSIHDKTGMPLKSAAKYVMLGVVLTATAGGKKFTQGQIDALLEQVESDLRRSRQPRGKSSGRRK